MPKIKYRDILYYDGSKFKILWAVSAGYSMPGKEFLDKLGRPDWGKLDMILCRLGDRGRIINKEQFRSVGDGLFEVKGGARRLVGYFIPDHFVLTHGFEKRGGGKAANKFPKKERQRALKIKEEFTQVFKSMKKGGGNGRKK